MIRITSNFLRPTPLANPYFIRAIGTKTGQQHDTTTKASPEQLAQVADKLSDGLVRFFVAPHPYYLYTKDVAFIDNIRNVKTQGITQYALQLTLVRYYYAIRYAQRKMQLLSLVKVPEESCIKIRWRITMRPGLSRLLAAVSKYHELENWRDGISTMHVNKDGLIYCHVCDNIDVDISEGKIKKTIKNSLVDRGLSV